MSDTHTGPTIIQQLPVELDDETLLVRSKALASKMAARERLEAEMKAAQQAAKSDINNLSEQITELHRVDERPMTGAERKAALDRRQAALPYEDDEGGTVHRLGGGA